MSKTKLNKKELDLLNSKIGLQMLLRKEHFKIEDLVDDIEQKHDFRKLQVKLVALQDWVIKNEKKVVILFEGRDGAGKTGTIRKISEYINPRHYRIVALNKPSDEERKQWYFQRYIQELPNPGEIVFFDRSWYNRAVVEPVNGFCSKEEYKVFMSQVNDFERMLVESDTYLIKFYFTIRKNIQAKRFEEMKANPMRKWNYTKVDQSAQELWNDYSKYFKRMLNLTHTKHAPWVTIDANSKAKSRSTVLKHLLHTIPYKK